MEKEDLARAIRAKCVECCGGSRALAAQCRICDCALHPYRPGAAEAPQKKDRGVLWDGEQTQLTLAAAR